MLNRYFLYPVQKLRTSIDPEGTIECVCIVISESKLFHSLVEGFMVGKQRNQTSAKTSLWKREIPAENVWVDPFLLCGPFLRKWGDSVTLLPSLSLVSMFLCCSICLKTRLKKFLKNFHINIPPTEYILAISLLMDVWVPNFSWLINDVSGTIFYMNFIPESMIVKKVCMWVCLHMCETCVLIFFFL